MKKKIILTYILIAIIAIIIVSVIYLNDFYKPDNTAKEAYETSIKDTDYYLFKSNSENAINVIIYPGGKVDYTSYSILAKKLSENGFNAYVLKMPFNLSILSNNKAHILEEEINSKFILMGHSLGGTSVSVYSYKHNDNLLGMVYLASYPIKDLNNSNVPTISFTASNDKILNMESYNKNKKFFPKNTYFFDITGGNHSQFGNYGHQKDDGEATISSDEQKDYIVNKMKEIYL